MIQRKHALIWVVVSALVASLVGVVVGQAGLLPPFPNGLMGWLPARNAAGEAGLDDLREVLHYVKDKYVEPLPQQELLNGAIRGLVEATGDKYSVYMTPDRYASFRRQFDDSFGGVGIMVELKDGYLTVVRPLQGSPGEQAGILPGDRIIKVDGRDITEMSLDESVQLIRGPQGTEVRLTFIRPPATDPREARLVRQRISTPTTQHRMLESGIGYLEIVEFNNNVHERVEAAIADMRRQGLRGLILDLRRNPGGLLTEAVSVSSVFVPRGPVVHAVGRTGERETYNSHSQGFDLPLVVLVDEGSASAAEIVAGAIRDRGAGVLVGTRTFGKGTVQTFFTLKDGAGLKLTTARYLTAGGYSINGRGIVPDIQVDVPGDAASQGSPLGDPQNPQLRRAVEVLRERMAAVR